MTHFGHRRHRLNPDEAPVVMRLVWNRLYELLETRMDPLYAERLYRILYRFQYYAPGRPCYPEFNWSMVDTLLSSINIEEGLHNDSYIDPQKEAER